MSARLLALATLVLSACAGAEPVTPGRGPDSPVGSTPGLSSPVAGPTALRVSPREGLIDVRPRAWERAVPVGRRRLSIEFSGGVEECEGLDRVTVEETPRRVMVSLFVGRVPDAHVCIEIAVLKSVTVNLDRPLADREVVDGNAGI